VMEQVSGRDLRTFFAQWLTRGGNPRVEASWTYDAARKALALTLRQTQPGDTYVLAVDVDVITPAGPRRETIRFETDSATVTLPLDVPPSAVTIDPDIWLLADIGFQPSAPGSQR